MAFSIDGIASGLDTTGLINQLMQLEARPQTLMKNKVTATQTLVSGLQQLNTRMASLAELAEKTAKPEALGLYSATTTSDKVTAAAGPTAGAGSIDITVDRLAQSQVSVSATMTAWPDSPAALTITAADGTTTEISPATNSLDDIVSALNLSEAGVTAVKVAAGMDPATGQTQYRLQFTAGESGSAGSFSIHRGTAAEVAAGTAPNLLSEPGAVQIRAGQDAQATLWAGTAAEQSVTSSSNTFTNLLPGVDVTVGEVSAEPVTVSVARDREAAAGVAKELINGLTGVLSFISVNSTVTAPGGATAARGGLFTGDNSVRDIEQRIRTAATAPVAGASPSEFGISITRSGSVEFDAEKFEEALSADPVRVQVALQEIASRIAAVSSEASDKFDGSITVRIQSQESQVRNLNDQVLDWDRRLEIRRSTLERTYASLEVQLQSMQSQGDWLSSQLANLPSMGGNKS